MTTTATTDRLSRIQELLGEESDSLLGHVCEGISKDRLHLPGPEHLDAVWGISDRNPRVLGNLQRLLSHGRLAGSGYLSLLPVDQGIEHSGAASFAPNPDYFDPENIVRLAIEGGCNGVASTLGVLGSVARRYAHKLPFIMKLNHNELLTQPQSYRQTIFARVEQAWDLGAVAVGATIYFGNEDAMRELEEISEAFQQAHELGMATILWCYLRNPVFKTAEADHHASADLTGQANHLGVTIQADIVKQKQATHLDGYRTLTIGRTHDLVYEALVGDHPVEWVRWQVANCYMGRVGLINSGGSSSGKGDLAQAVRTAVINKRAGGMGMISGRKAFQRPMREGVGLLHAIQDVYLCDDVTVA